MPRDTPEEKPGHCIVDLVRDTATPMQKAKAFSSERSCGIIEKLHELQKDPDSQKIDVDKLKGEAGYRLRIGPYRIIYTRDSDQLIIEVVKVRTRGDIYKR